MIKYGSPKVKNIEYEDTSGVALRGDEIGLYFFNKMFPIFLQDDRNTPHKNQPYPSNHLDQLKSIIYA